VISLLLPTRGRPALVQRLFDSIATSTANLDNIEVILYVDDDDVDSHALDSDRFKVDRIIGPPTTMGHYNSTCLARSRGEIVILANDDMVIRTPGWDERVAAVHAEYPDGVYLAYCNDLFKNRGWCTFPILSRRTCQLLGDPYPVIYRGAFIDTHLVDIFKRLEHAGENRIRYLSDVVFEHLHYRVGKAEFDATYRKRGRFLDDHTFVALATSRRERARRLLDAVRGRADLPPATEPPRPAVPAGLPSALLLYSKTFLLDFGLPLRWRTFLWYWFVGRYLAAKGWLGPLGR
jgi:glycosyltransferase involved in cell wall biosynthesis